MSKEVVFSYFVFYLVTIKAEIDVGYDVNQTTTVVSKMMYFLILHNLIMYLIKESEI